jgi:hypothetical protein
MKEHPRQYSLVKVGKKQKEWLEANAGDSPLLKDKAFIYLGEIPNMPEHCVVAGVQTGLILGGFDIDNFVELSDDEI